MYDDLSDARACLDWTISNLPTFEEHLLGWLKNNVEVVVVDLPNGGPNDVIVAREKEPVPIFFNIEAGAYINTIRSSLDILAYTIGARDKVIFPNTIYFPVAESAADFASGKYKGADFVKQLSGTARKLIESVRPYQGGNEALWALHRFDILRKHRRLLAAEVHPQKLHVHGFGLSQTFTPTALVPAGNGETVLGLLAKGAKKPAIEYTAMVIFNEPTVMKRCGVSSALNYFASAAREIIGLFDC